MVPILRYLNKSSMSNLSKYLRSSCNFYGKLAIEHRTHDPKMEQPKALRVCGRKGARRAMSHKIFGLIVTVPVFSSYSYHTYLKVYGT